MKIVHVTEAFEGGVIEFLRCLTQSTPDFSYTIIYGRPQFFEKAYKTFPSNVEFIFWPHASREINPARDVKALRGLIKILKAQKTFDVLHLHSSKAGILGRIAARAVKHTKVIYAPHGAAFLRKDISFLTRSLYITIEKAATIFPAKVVGVSRSEAETYRRIGIKADYVNNGKFFPPAPEKSNHKNVFTIVTTGRIVNQKHPAWFNEIATMFVHDEAIKFIWIGEGAEKKLLTSPNISVTGWVDKSEVENLLMSADLYLSTALWEGLPYAVLEAMSMRLPLLLSDCPGNSDLVENNVNGFLYARPKDAIQFIHQYLLNRELLHAHGEASFNMLRTAFSVEQMAEGYRRIYSSFKL
jgi:glycosyltransferase involved in cell wall biosynthesis